MWHAELKRRFKSDAKVAADLFPKWKKQAREEVDREGTTQTALANRIGRLARFGDDTRWWAARPKVSQLLADKLEVEPSDIFGRASTPGDLEFAHFPRLPPLQRVEALCRTSRGGSVYDSALAALNTGAHAWITVPAGGGKSAAITLLSARFGGELRAVTAPTLANALGVLHPTDRPVAIEIDEPVLTEDGRILAALERYPAAVVLAPFPRPGAKTDRALSPAPEAGWRDVNGSPEPGWIDRMLTWIAARLDASLGDGKFDPDEVRNRLLGDVLLAASIQTPGDLLSFCGYVDREGLDDEPIEALAGRWLTVETPRVLPADAPRSWRDFVAASAVRSTIHADLLDMNVAWGSRPFSLWSSMIPSTEAPARDGDEPGQIMAVTYLRAAGVFRGDAKGAIAYPRWVARGIGLDAIKHLLEKSTLTGWGHLAADESRRDLVDAALDDLTPDRLATLGSRVLAAAAKDAAARPLAVVAAVEATTAAMGRRLSAHEASPRERDLARRLLEEQLRHLVPVAGAHAIPLPTTRPKRDEWFLTGWAISLATAPPAHRVPDNLAWIIPGWASGLRLTSANPHALPWSVVDSPPYASAQVRGVTRLAFILADRLPPDPLPLNLPRVLLPALFASGRWAMHPVHLRSLKGTWEEHFLAGEAAILSAERRERLATSLWHLARHDDEEGSSAPVAERVEVLREYPSLLEFVLKNLPADTVRSTASTAGTHRRYLTPGTFRESAPENLRLLSPELRLAAIRGWLESARPHEARWIEAQALAAVTDRPDLDLLLEILREADSDTAGAFAERVWRTAPQRALVEAQLSYKGGAPSAAGWFEHAPRDQLAALLDLVHRTGPQGWVASWALRRLPDGGALAQVLYELSAPARCLTQ